MCIRADTGICIAIGAFTTLVRLSGRAVTYPMKNPSGLGMFDPPLRFAGHFNIPRLVAGCYSHGSLAGGTSQSPSVTTCQKSPRR
jgi:hypothetical protein